MHVYSWSKRQESHGSFDIKKKKRKIRVWHLNDSFRGQESVSLILPMPVDMITCYHTEKLLFFQEKVPLPVSAFEESDLLLELQSEDIWAFLGWEKKFELMVSFLLLRLCQIWSLLFERWGNWSGNVTQGGVVLVGGPALKPSMRWKAWSLTLPSLFLDL